MNGTGGTVPFVPFSFFSFLPGHGSKRNPFLFSLQELILKRNTGVLAHQHVPIVKYGQVFRKELTA